MKNLNLPIQPYTVLELFLNRYNESWDFRLEVEEKMKKSQLNFFMHYLGENSGNNVIVICNTKIESTDKVNFALNDHFDEFSSQPWLKDIVDFCESLLEFSLYEYLSLFLNDQFYYDDDLLLMLHNQHLYLILNGRVFVIETDNTIKAVNINHSPKDTNWLDFEHEYVENPLIQNPDPQTVTMLLSHRLAAVYYRHKCGWDDSVSKLYLWWISFLNTKPAEYSYCVENFFGFTVQIEGNSRVKFIDPDNHYTFHFGVNAGMRYGRLDVQSVKERLSVTCPRFKLSVDHGTYKRMQALLYLFMYRLLGFRDHPTVI